MSSNPIASRSLADLSASAAQIVVAAASTDPSKASSAAKQTVMQLLGPPDDPERELLAELQLDQTRDQLQATSGQEREQARAALEAVWRTQLTDLLQAHPEKARDLKEQVGQIRAKLHDSMVEAGQKAHKHKQWRDALQPLPTIFDWYKANAVAGTLLAAGFVVLKGYVIARGDLATALGILQYTGLATVVIAGLLSSLPILAAAMLAYTVIQMTGPSGARGRDWRLAVVTLNAFVLSAVFTPWTYLAIAVAIGVAVGLVRRWTHGARKWGAVLLYGVAAAVAVVSVIVNLNSVWVPHEIVTFRPGILPDRGTVEVGYVLSESNGWITMLTTGQKEHTIVRFPDATAKQVVCERQPNRDDPWSLIFYAVTPWRLVTGVNPYLGASANTRCPYHGL